MAEETARDLLRELSGVPGAAAALRVADAEGRYACLIQVWPAAVVMPAASAERRRRANGGRARCREDVLRVVRAACRPLTRKEVVRALQAAGTPHGVGTVGKALADLTAAGELVNPRDKRGYRMKEWPRRPRTRNLFRIVPPSLRGIAASGCEPRGPTSASTGRRRRHNAGRSLDHPILATTDAASCSLRSA